MYHILFFCLSVDGHLGCFQSLAIISRTTINVVEQLFLLSDESSFQYMPKSGIAGLGGNENHHTEFHSGCKVCVLNSNELLFPSLHIFLIRMLNISLSVSEPFEFPVLRVICFYLYSNFN